MRLAAGWQMAVLVVAAAAGAAESLWIEGESPAATTFNRHPWYHGDPSLRRDLLSPGEAELVSGDWLAHYVSGAPTNTAVASYDLTVTEGGSYAWWIRLNPRASYRYAIGAGPWQPLDTADWREWLNLVGPIDNPGIDFRWIAWVKAADLTLAPGTTRVSVQVTHDPVFDASHGGIDCMVVVNFPWEPLGVLQPGQVVAAPGPAVWYPLPAGDDPFSPASLTDLRRLWHAPAGRYGPLRRAGAGFEFRARPGQPVKLWGTNLGDLLPTEALQRQQARYYAKHGINLIRFHPLESWLGVLEDDGLGGRRLNPGRLDRFDRWFSIARENGIYLALSAFFPHILTPADAYPAAEYAELADQGGGKSSSGVVAFMPAAQDAEWEWLRRFLDHLNPYTGLSYKDDPALAIIEAHNEDSIFWHWPLNPLSDPGGSLPLHRAELQRQWMEWLRARYGTDTALAAAWGAGLRPGDSIANPAMGIYGAWQMAADGPDLGAGVVLAERPRLGDFIRFLAETQRGYYERRRAQIAGLGSQALFVTTAWMAGGPAAEAANLWCDDAGDAIDRHAYWGAGGSLSWRMTRGPVNNQSHLDRPGRGIVGGRVYDSGGIETPLYQVEDKPVVMSEWTSSPPNQWKAEVAPLQAFYGMGLQGWDASIHFAGSLARIGNGWPWGAWSPDFYVTETPHYLGQFPALVFALHNRHFAEGDLAAARRLDPGQIFAGFDALSRDLPGGGWPGDTNLVTPPETLAIGRVTFQAGTGLAASARSDWTAWWNPAAGTIDSSTGQLRWDYRNRVVLARSDRTQGVIGWGGGRSWDLPGVRIDLTTPFVSLLLTPLDDLPLDRSRQILVTALARDRQINTLYDPSGDNLLQIGGPPLLLEPVQATLTFLGDPIDSARAVDIHGVPTATTLPVSANAITIDGRYQTFYYEVRRAAPCSPELSRAEVTALVPLTPPRASVFLAIPRPDGVSLDPSAPLARVPYLCPFATGSSDPEAVLDPPASPLVFYQLAAPGPIRLVEDPATRSVRVHF